MVNKKNYHHYKRISVIGAGAWGTALAEVISRQGNQVNLWAREADVVKSIKKWKRPQGQNEKNKREVKSEAPDTP